MKPIGGSWCTEEFQPGKIWHAMLVEGEFTLDRNELSKTTNFQSKETILRVHVITLPLNPRAKIRSTFYSKQLCSFLWVLKYCGEMILGKCEWITFRVFFKLIMFNFLQRTSRKYNSLPWYHWHIFFKELNKHIFMLWPDLWCLQNSPFFANRIHSWVCVLEQLLWYVRFGAKWKESP